MSRSHSTIYTALRLAGAQALRLSQNLESFASDSRQAVGEFLAQVMNEDEREAFTLERYSLSSWEPQVGAPLPKWEAAWFASDLPKPPARLLLPGCGSGRELLPLIEQGYETVAFDGAPGALAIARRLCGGRADVRTATFRDFIDASLGKPGGPLRDLSGKRFDAVLLGWGCLTHAAGSKRRREVLAACQRMTDGPILASFYSDSKKPPSRAARWGKHVAKRLGRVGDGPSPVEFSHWGGFAEYVTKEEMAAHAASLRRNVNWLEGGTIPFPCVTLLAKTD